MKTQLRKLTYVLFILAGAFASCQNKKMDDSKEMAEEQNEEKFDTKAGEKDAQFVVDVVAANNDEIKWANYALLNSTNAEIKTLAQKMVDDHTAAGNSLTNVASSKSISVPMADSTEVDKKIKNWNDKKPSAWDKDWTKEMIDMHKKTINKLEDGQKNVTDADIKSWIDNTLPTVRTHLQMLEECDAKLK